MFRLAKLADVGVELLLETDVADVVAFTIAPAGPIERLSISLIILPSQSPPPQFPTDCILKLFGIELL